MQVVEMLLRNLVEGNLAASAVRYWLIREHSGILLVVKSNNISTKGVWFHRFIHNMFHHLMVYTI